MKTRTCNTHADPAMVTARIGPAYANFKVSRGAHSVMSATAATEMAIGGVGLAGG